MSWRKRLLRFPLVRVVIAAAPIVALLIGMQVVGSVLDVHDSVVALVAGIGAVVLYIAHVRLVERRRVDELASAGAPAELARGFLLGSLLFATTIAVLWLVGACTIDRGGGLAALVFALAAATGAALTEEILVRAILFRVVEHSLGTWIALALSAALFGLLHAFNPGATVTSTVAIALEAGIILAAALVLTRRLWMAFGLHAAWNFTEGGVFGATVSGTASSGWFNSRFRGAPLLTGGEFGPEASIVAVIVCLTAGIVLLVVGRRRGHFVRPFWRR